MSPSDDMFLSGALDKTLRLWDLKSPNCQGLMNLTGRPVAAFDPEGLVFAAGVNSESVKLYDLRSFDKVIFYCNIESEEKTSDISFSLFYLVFFSLNVFVVAFYLYFVSSTCFHFFVS